MLFYNEEGDILEGRTEEGQEVATYAVPIDLRGTHFWMKSVKSHEIVGFQVWDASKWIDRAEDLTIEALIQKCEELSRVHVGVASSFSSIRQYLLYDPYFRLLRVSIERSHEAETKVWDRVQELAKTPTDAQYLHPQDHPITALLLCLGQSGILTGETTLEVVETCPNLGWAYHAVRYCRGVRALLKSAGEVRRVEVEEAEHVE